MSSPQVVDDIVNLLSEGRTAKMCSLKGWVTTMKEFFGTNGKDLTKFRSEVRSLSYEVKMEFWQMLQDAGIPCDKPIEVPAQ